MSYTSAPAPMSTTDEADSRIAKIVADVLDGNRTEKSGRAEIAGILCGTGILGEIAAGEPITPMEREELEANLQALMLTKILTANGEKNMNFERLNGSSACGWFRQFARAATPSEMRRVRNMRKRFGVPVDMMASAVGGPAFGDMATPEAVNTPWAANLSAHKTTEELAHEESASQLIEEFTETARYLRGPVVTFVKADTLRRFYDLPNATRLPDPQDRQFVLDELEKDNKIAYKSASIAFRLRTGEIDRDEVKTDMRLVEIWNSHDTETLDSLLDRPGEVAHTLATVASMQRPRPNSVALNRFRRLVSVISDLPEWKPVAEELAEAYIATEFNAVSAYNEPRLSEDELAELSAKHQSDQKRWAPAVKAAMEFVGRPTGASEAEIRRTLDSHAMAAGAIESSYLKKPEAKKKKTRKKAE